MLSHSQSILESEEDKLSSSTECTIRNLGLWNRIPSRLNARWQSEWAIEDPAKTIARPYDQQQFSPLDRNAGRLSHPALAIANPKLHLHDCF